ncbi:hypothetical protein IC614_07035 [Allosphingosinicella flava]|uniref:Uncharacterized protein n=1 Tax=Allosphingosinicella flava TaxID=2771430 RepID=A0A7T2GHT4_9SPHN|nr:hypothetical protein [Sphingosinicella flava]QPQ54125.1 hypothetical protein IC614_07035 [Sphingosinicella flava]
MSTKRKAILLTVGWCILISSVGAYFAYTMPTTPGDDGMNYSERQDFAWAVLGLGFALSLITCGMAMAAMFLASRYIRKAAWLIPLGLACSIVALFPFLGLENSLVLGIVATSIPSLIFVTIIRRQLGL